MATRPIRVTAAFVAARLYAHRIDALLPDFCSEAELKVIAEQCLDEAAVFMAALKKRNPDNGKPYPPGAAQQGAEEEEA